MSIALLFLSLSGCNSSDAPDEIPFGFIGKRSQAFHEDHSFFLTIPLPQGELMDPEGWEVEMNGQPVATSRRAAVRWPDESVAWLQIEGRLPAGVNPVGQGRLVPTAETVRDSGVAWKAVLENDEIRLQSQIDGQEFRLVPGFRVVPVARQMGERVAHLSYPEDDGQFLWAAPWSELGSGQEITLNPVVRQVELEPDGPGSLRIQGVAGEGSLQVEWQLRIRPETGSSLLRIDSTVVAHLNPDEHALSHAAWSLKSVGQPFELIYEEIAGEGGEAVPANSNPLFVAAPDGMVAWIQAAFDATVSEAAASPAWVLQSAGHFTGISFRNLGRLGPAAVEFSPDNVEIRVWDSSQRVALDLRRTGEDEEFGQRGVDLRFNGRGTGRTLTWFLAAGGGKEAVLEQVSAPARQQTQLFADRATVLRSGVFGWMDDHLLEQAPEFFAGLRANIHFLLRSREHWRWMGFINYGDVRTNFARGTNETRGLYPGYWARFGRYGWRNGSGDVYHRLLHAGLLMEDPYILEAALDYARHVADVDIQQPSFFAAPKNNQGGMHRRNIDHWSGSVQMQYSPSNGLYLASWLSGDPRISEALEGLRGFARNDGGRTSALAAQAWILRYAETRDPEDLAIAEELLSNLAEWWGERNTVEELSDLAAIYAGNFRWVSDGVMTLIPFHQWTGDPKYLEVITEQCMAVARAGGSYENLANPGQAASPFKPNTTDLFAMAYILNQGVSRDLFPETFIDRVEWFAESLAPTMEVPVDGNYEELEAFILNGLPPAGSPAYRESNSIGRRALTSFLLMQEFGPGEQSSPDEEVD